MQIGGFQLIDQLCLIRATQLIYSFQLNHDLFKTNKIRTVTALQTMSLVFNRDGDFALERYVTPCHLNCQCFLINSFKKTVPQLTMHFHRRAHDLVSLRIFVHFR